MHILLRLRWTLLPVLFLVLGCAPSLVREKPRYDYKKMNKNIVRVHQKIVHYLDTCAKSRQPVALVPGVRIDSLKLDSKQKTLEVYMNKAFSFPAYREETVSAFYDGLRKELGGKYKKYRITLYTLGQPLEELVPNYFRSKPASYDLSRMPRLPLVRPTPLITRLSRPFKADSGLENRVIDLRPSHGWYYNSQSDRWEWQRPRMFETVEDLLPFSFVIPYLAPMLENAGATVFIPRERDIQTHEVVVDEDLSGTLKELRSMGNIQYTVRVTGDTVPSAGSIYQESCSDSSHTWRTGSAPGFALGHPPYAVNVNPFLQGSFRAVRADSSESAIATYQPQIPETGDYAVYISYHGSPDNAEDVLYRVYHAGGQSEFRINQQIGGGTWIYLGTFRFLQGRHPETGQVMVSNRSTTPGRWITADAVRFGGGMGDVLRNAGTSGRPRFAEGSRYYLQYAGMPDTLIYNLSKSTDDYKDDYNSRSEYLNYLYGAPFGPKKNRQAAGLGIPFDLSLAFHTDAGISRNDTTIGTLAIYSMQSSDSLMVFPDSVSRMANRDLADMMQSEIVKDVRALYDPSWNRRHLMDGQYSEAVRPNVPSTLIELLSHQNFLDMKFALDPRFRFDVSRAMYKGILKFIAFQNRIPYAVQPLPVDHLQALFSGERQVTLKWQPRADALEPSARPAGYVVYERQNDGGFDNGRFCGQSEIVFPDLTPGAIYSFKITAINAGGESFPSEILAVCWQDTLPPVLVINGFDRICAPAWIDGANFSGFADFIDQGVPDRYTMNYAGPQLDYHPSSPYRTNDAPGHGASSAEFETQVIAGNTFDFVYAHGVSLANLGKSFVSCSDEAMMDEQVDITRFSICDLILGEEKTTPWPTAAGDSLRGPSFEAIPQKLQRQLERFRQSKGGLMVSGSYLGSDLLAGRKKDDANVTFASRTLRLNWAADHASSDGQVVATGAGFLPRGTAFAFNTTADKNIYRVEAPDAIDPVMGGRTILRYRQNQFSAAIAYRDEYAVVAFGFPFETIKGQEDRDRVMSAAMNFLSTR